MKDRSSLNISQLHVGVIEGRNLKGVSYAWEDSIDSYCIIRFGGRIQRTFTSPRNHHPQWNETFTFDLANSMKDPELTIEVFNEKNFFFNMFPSDETSMEEKQDEKVLSSQKSFVVADEPIGLLTIPLGMILNSKQPAQDNWWILNGIKSGEVRIQTYFVMDIMNPPNGCYNANEWLKLYLKDLLIYDQYGFEISSRHRIKWNHFRSYITCREQRQISNWDNYLSSIDALETYQLEIDYKFKYLVYGGIPKHLRKTMYMRMSGARNKKLEAETGYYQSLVEDSQEIDSISTKQIELDIGRTFGSSHTKLATMEGKNSLRRVLRAYSLRNPKVGYCQGLNFIVGFLLLSFDEESVFWLLSVICEEYFPGYYTSTMYGTQTDILVLKEFISEKLPALDLHTSKIGVPLELLASQWLLCLFTTTFPSDTVLRIMDCLFLEGSSFVFSIIIGHLRQLESLLLELKDFQSIVSNLKEVESEMYDADALIPIILMERKSLTNSVIETLRIKHESTVSDEMERVQRVRILQRQLAIVQQIPAFSTYAAQMLRFFHKEAEVASRTDVAFFLTLLCHGIVWLADQSRSKRK